MDNVIEVREITKFYQMGEVEVRALRGVSFDIERGEVVSIMGPSGSGKIDLDEYARLPGSAHIRGLLSGWGTGFQPDR